MDKTMDEDAAGPSSESANLATLFQFFEFSEIFLNVK